MSTTLHPKEDTDALFQSKLETLEAKYKTKYELEMKTIKDDYYRFKAKHHNYLIDGPCYDDTDDRNPFDNRDCHKEALQMIAEEYGYAYINLMCCSVNKHYIIELGPNIDELKELQEDIDKFKKAFPVITPGAEVSNHYEKYNEETLGLLAYVHKLTHIICKKEGGSPTLFTIKFGLNKDEIIERSRRKINALQNDIHRLQESPPFAELIKCLKF